MNDFTKEELELMEWYVRKEKVVPDIPYLHIQLLRKLQSMIDHYEEDKKVKDALNYILLKARKWKLEL